MPSRPVNARRDGAALAAGVEAPASPSPSPDFSEATDLCGDVPPFVAPAGEVVDASRLGLYRDAHRYAARHDVSFSEAAVIVERRRRRATFSEPASFVERRARP
jgi:hypothetical protein